MTQQEQALADDKMRAEISKLVAETQLLNQETRKALAQNRHLAAETKQITLNTFLAPFLAAAGIMGATAAIVKVFLS